MTIFWIFKLIKYVNLKYRKYNTLNIKVNYKLDILDKIRNF